MHRLMCSASRSSVDVRVLDGCARPLFTELYKRKTEKELVSKVLSQQSPAAIAVSFSKCDFLLII